MVGVGGVLRRVLAWPLDVLKEFLALLLVVLVGVEKLGLQVIVTFVTPDKC